MIEIHNLSLRQGKFALRNINLKINKGEFFALLGPTGSGKTTLLECIAGLKKAASGRVIVNGRDITHERPEKRKISIVYQDYALFPHLRVKDNITYGLRFQKNGKDAYYQQRFQLLTELLHIKHLLERYPGSLSGGEKQRVALARALLTEPQLLLLDEPLSALDDNIKAMIQGELKNLHQQLGMTIIMVTHNFADTHALAERVGILREGQLVEVGRIDDVFRRPRTLFTANFVGIKNIFKVEARNGKCLLPDGRPLVLDAPPQKGFYYAGIRPECISLHEPAKKLENRFSGKVRQVTSRGVYLEVEIESGELVFKAYVMSGNKRNPPPVEGSDIVFGFSSDDVCLIPNEQRLEENSLLMQNRQ